jgi:hypothetical protein
MAELLLCIPGTCPKMPEEETGGEGVDAAEEVQPSISYKSKLSKDENETKVNLHRSQSLFIAICNSHNINLNQDTYNSSITYTNSILINGLSVIREVELHSFTAIDLSKQLQYAILRSQYPIDQHINPDTSFEALMGQDQGD